MLLPRVITAVVGIPVVFLAIYFGSIPFLLFVIFITFFSSLEYYMMMKVSNKDVEPISLFFSSFLIPISFHLSGFSALKGNFIPLVISLCIILAFTVEIFKKTRSIERIGYTLIGTFFISYTLSHLLFIRNIDEYGRILSYLLFISVWVCDTMAYFVGLNFGRKKLSSVSPKKTVEGFIAGFVSSVFFFYFTSKIYNFMTQLEFIILGVICGVAGQYSDLAQSLIKRVCGVKDSSNLLPGHGGVFDRFDSFIFLGPFVYYYIVFTL